MMCMVIGINSMVAITTGRDAVMMMRMSMMLLSSPCAIVAATPSTTMRSATMIIQGHQTTTTAIGTIVQRHGVIRMAQIGHL